VVLAEEAAYWDRGMATSLPGPGLGGAPVLLMGTAEQQERFLSRFKGKDRPRWAAFAMTEPSAGSDVASIRTRARKDGDSWVIDGEKCFSSNGARAEWVVVWATIDPAAGRAGHRAFVVEADTPGFTVARVEHKMGLAASETASLVFENCRIPVENMLGTSDESKAGFKGAMRTFDMTRPMVAAMAVGIAQACHDETTRIAKTAFEGNSGWRLQAAQDRLAWMRRKVEVGRLLAWRAAWLADHHQPNVVEASTAKATCATIGLQAASLGLDIAGQSGLADPLIDKLWRDVKALDIVEGTGQIQRRIIARRLISHGDQK
jgi:acyl-CoA dehydrogenase